MGESVHQVPFPYPDLGQFMQDDRNPAIGLSTGSMPWVRVHGYVAGAIGVSTLDFGVLVLPAMPTIIVVILIFVGIVMLVLSHACVVEWVFRRRHPSNNNNAGATEADRGSTSMSKADVEMLPCFDFVSKEVGVGDGNGSPVNCAVCLENFKVGEKCRLLPICSHSFHADCVDAWLVKMPSCPICRSRADSGRLGPVEGISSGHFSDFSLGNMESQTGTDSSRFSDSRSDLSLPTAGTLVTQRAVTEAL
ncbi:hypothetical protein SAY87_007199 [Trapa incisa]|uniref:RING-type E3 ubiquitin transferase n=1 Tax=Trapa incisa TaxID=236973 RepID=A0AAN7K2G3_9MYRT|nr:hypothetical protein SAY87_007199 [Trapa incisa]